MTDKAIKYLRFLASKGVKKVRYFHCDHFEPWRQGVQQLHGDELAMFCEQSQRQKFASKMTLFYKPHVPYTFLDHNSPADVAHVGNEKIGFPQLTDAQNKIANSAMSAVAALGHEIQIHIHHEGYTLSDVNHFPAVKDWLDENGTEQGDSARLRLTTERHLEQARMDTGAKLDRWAFVHGNWALNGSDDKICRIHDEIKILQSLGCVADFTFPAGRRQVDPDILFEPYTCLPTTEKKTYNLPSSDPRPVTDPLANSPGRFFIWHTAQRHPLMSLDIYSSSVQKRFEDPGQVVEDWVCQAPAYDDAIYIKTYAHSMNKRYFDEMDAPVIPHLNPKILETFTLLEDIIDKAGMELEITTAMNVYDTLLNSSKPVNAVNIDPNKFSKEESTTVVTVRRKAKTMLKSIVRRLKPTPPTYPIKPYSNKKVPLADIDAASVSVMKQRFEKMGETDSGAYGFYKVRIERDELVTRFERELADAIVERDPEVAEIIDIGAGLGSMVLAFTALGRRAVGLEYDRRRVAAANEIISKLRKTYPAAGNRIDVIQGKFPENSPERTIKKGLFAGITTNIMGTLPSETEDAIIAGLTHFDVCYVDLQRFCNARSTDDEYQALLARMHKAGLKSQSLLLDQDSAGYYYRLAKA